MSCHRQPDIRAEVATALIVRIQKVEALGPLYGKDIGEPIKKLGGFDDLWELRYRHSTGMYRQFFRFASIGGSKAACFVDGAVKKRRLLPRHVLDAADARLDHYIADLRQDPDAQKRDRLP
jgi:hypothetical protein